MMDLNASIMLKESISLKENLTEVGIPRMIARWKQYIDFSKLK